MNFFVAVEPTRKAEKLMLMAGRTPEGRLNLQGLTVSDRNDLKLYLAQYHEVVSFGQLGSDLNPPTCFLLVHN